MSGRKTERKRLFNQMIREDIQDAVKNLVTRTGSRKLTMDQIAIEAGVSKGCLYLHFKNKKELLESVREVNFRPLANQLQGILNEPVAPDKKIENFVRRMFGYFDENQGLFRFLLEEREIAQSQVARQKDSRYRNFVERIAGVLNDGIVAGFFRNLECRKVASMLLEAMIAMTARRLMDEDPGPVEEDAQLLIEVFIRGIALIPGPH